MTNSTTEPSRKLELQFLRSMDENLRRLQGRIITVEENMRRLMGMVITIEIILALVAIANLVTLVIVLTRL